MSSSKHISIIAILLIIITGTFGLQRSNVGAAGAFISGVVRDESGAGIGGVEVVSDNGAPKYTGIRITTTNPDGSFTLVDVQSGLNHLRASVSGRAAAHYWNFEVQADQVYSGINFVLRPGGGSISGRVSDAQGQGMPEAEVNIFEMTSLGFDNGTWAYTTTDVDGYFVSDALTEGGLATGRYLVMVTAAVSARQENVQVVAGQETSGVSLTFHSGEGTISGRIVEAATNQPVVGARVVADNTLIQSEGLSDDQGYYRLNGFTTSGYNVLVTNNGFANTHAYGVLVTDGFETSGVDFSLSAQIGQISGRVTTLEGEPLAGVALLADSNEGDGFGNGVSDSNGNFLIENLEPMMYLVHTSHPDYANVNVEAQVQEGSTTIGIDFHLSTTTGGIGGRVMMDGQPAPLATIYVNGRDCTWSCTYGYGVTDENGYYTVWNLLSGEVDVHVSGVPGYINQVRYQIDLGNDFINGVDFNLTNGNGFVEGFVKDVDGNLVEGAKIQFFQLSNPGVWVVVTSDNYGYYSAAGLWSGDYHVYGDHVNFPAVILSYVPIPEQIPTQIDLVFGQERSLVADPSRVAVMLEGDQTANKLVKIDVLAGGPAIWMAESSAEWLLLGESGETYQASGLTGQDGLLLRFSPSKADYGIFTTDVLLTAVDAYPTTIQVTLTKLDPDTMSLEYLPLVEFGH